MSDNSNTSEMTEVGVNGNDATIVANQPETVSLAQFKELEWEYTRRRQSEIDKTVKLAQLDPAILVDEKDVKLKNAVVKQLYWYDTFAEAEAVLGRDFLKKTNSSDDDDDIAKLRKELNHFKYRQESNELENAIRLTMTNNPSLARSEEKIRDELRYISKDLPVEERVRRATTLAFGLSSDPKTLAYQALANSAQGGGSSSASPIQNSNSQSKQYDEWKAILKGTK